MLAGCVKEKHACVIREVRTLAKVSIVIKGAQSRLNGLKSLAKLFKFRCL